MTKKIIGVMPGGFNLLHAGHLEALRFAKEHCTYLVCVVVRDQGNKHKVYQEPIEDRYMKLKAVKYVDEVIPCENEYSMLELMKLLEYDKYFLSDEYKREGFEDGKAVVGVLKLHYIPRRHHWSTTNEVTKIHEKVYDRLHQKN